MLKCMQRHRSIDIFGSMTFVQPPNMFGLDEKAMGKEFTMKIVAETHQFWQQFIESGKKTV